MKLGTADDVPAEGGQSIVVQPFGGYQETQIEFCDTRGWGVSQQCNRANVYGFHAGDYQDTWKQPWTPVPVQGDVAGYDRPVQWDVYTSTVARVRLHGRQAVGVRRAAGRAHARRARHRRLPRRHLSLRHRRDGHARRHRPPVRAQLQPLPQRSPHGRLRHRPRARRRRRGTRRCCPAGRSGMAARKTAACVARPSRWSRLRRRAAAAAAPTGRRRGAATRRSRPDVHAPTSAPRSRRCATTTAPPPADPSNRVADDPAARALRPAAVLRPGVLGAAARGRQRRHDRHARHAGRGRPRELRGLPRARRRASSTRAARTSRSRSPRSGRCAARRRCSRSRSRRSTTGTGVATRSGTRPSA